MSRLLTTVLAGCAALALSGVSFADDQRDGGAGPGQEQTKDDPAGQATVEMHGQVAADVNDQDEQAATDADDEDSVVIVVPAEDEEDVAAAADEQDEQAATDAVDEEPVVTGAPEDQGQDASVETTAGAPASEENQLPVQEQASPADGKADGVANTDDAAFPRPDYSAELRKCEWAQGKRRTHCIEATRKKFGDM